MTEQSEEDRRDHEAAEALQADAVLNIRRAKEMTEERKLAIAEWLRQKATDLLAEGHEYAECFTARYNPDPGSEVSP